MTLRRTLTSLIREVVEEAERNPSFEARLRDVLSTVEKLPPKTVDKTKGDSAHARADGPANQGGGEIHGGKRPSNRRPPAVLDPVKLAREGEQFLRTALKSLSLDQLRDVVAEYGMDTGKLVIKWRSPERIIDRIVELSMARAQKGDAFRG